MAGPSPLAMSADHGPEKRAIRRVLEAARFQSPDRRGFLPMQVLACRETPGKREFGRDPFPRTGGRLRPRGAPSCRAADLSSGGVAHATQTPPVGKSCSTRGCDVRFSSRGLLSRLVGERWPGAPWCRRALYRPSRHENGTTAPSAPRASFGRRAGRSAGARAPRASGRRRVFLCVPGRSAVARSVEAAGRRARVRVAVAGAPRTRASPLAYRGLLRFDASNAFRRPRRGTCTGPCRGCA